MGTHCYIAKQVGPDQYRTIYCHLDGYLEEAGAHLAGHYDTEEQVDKLLDLGDIYYLQDKLDPDPSMAHYAPSRQKGVTFAYGRDMDDNRWPATIKSMEELEENNNWCEFLFIFKPQEGWEFLQIWSVRWTEESKGMPRSVWYPVPTGRTKRRCSPGTG